MLLQKIERRIENFGSKNFNPYYQLRASELYALVDSNKHPLEIAICAFEYGYVQGAKATNKKWRNKGAQ